MRYFLIIFTVFLVSDIFAATGIVVYNKTGCRSRYVVETNNGYAILEWYGGNDPIEGSKLVGDFESYGFKDIYNVTADMERQEFMLKITCFLRVGYKLNFLISFVIKK